MHLGHRKSIDIDLFSNEKEDKRLIFRAITNKFPETEVFITEHNLIADINGVRVEIYDDWLIPFRRKPAGEHGLRLAALEDLAAFKLSSITERREKKDYIDLYFLFEELGALSVLKEFPLYNPLLSQKSILFALKEVEAAEKNQSPMPDMLMKVTWPKIRKSMLTAAKDYLRILQKERREHKAKKGD